MTKKRRVVIIGGGGFLGSRALQALERVEGLTVQSLSRSSSPRMDLSDGSTFGALRGADLVIDLADTSTFPPDELARYCLREGLVLLETSSDLAVILRLRAISEPRAKGAVVLGAGIFTGISNLMAHEAARRAGQDVELYLGIRTSPFSGAGKGTVALMAKALAQNALSHRDGELVEHGPVARGARLMFPKGEASTLRVALAEQAMIQAGTGATNVDVYFSPKPPLLVWAFLLIPSFLARAAWFGGFMRAYFTVLRRFILPNRASTTELVVQATGSAGSVALSAFAPDGMATGGVAVAAIARELLELPVPPVGVKLVDELVGLRPIVAGCHALGGEACLVVSGL